MKISPSVAFARRVVVGILPLVLLIPVVAFATDDGTWSPVPTPPTTSGVGGYYDAPRHRMLILDQANSLWSFDLRVGGMWTNIVPAGTLPPSVSGAAVVLDVSRDRLVAWLGTPAAAAPADRLWELTLTDPPTWHELSQQGLLPVARQGAACIYDAQDDRLVLYGGSATDPIVGAYRLNGVWTLSFNGGANQWDSLAVGGEWPVWQPGVTPLYDPVRNRFVVYMGQTETGSTLWSLPLSAPTAWTERNVYGLSPRQFVGTAQVYDSAQDRELLFGGIDGSGSSSPETWVLPLADGGGGWTQLPSLDTGFAYSAAVYDAEHARVVVHGGEWILIQGGTFGGSSYSRSTNALDLAGTPAWSTLNPSDGPLNWGGALFADDAGNRLLQFVPDSGHPPGARVWAQALDGTWAWTGIVPGGDVPAGALVPLAADHPGRRLFAYDPTAAQLYAYAMATDRWTAMATVGAPPSFTPVVGAYDEVGQRLFLYGSRVSPLNGVTYSTLCVLPLDPAGSFTWQEYPATGTRPGWQYADALFYDPASDALTASDQDGNFFHLAPAASATWTDVPYYFPQDHGAAAYAWDSRRGRVLVFGGTDVGSYTNAVIVPEWGTAPVALAPTGTPPSPRATALGVYDARHDRMVIEGGHRMYPNTTFTDSYTLTFSDPPRPMLLCGGDVVWATGASNPVGWTVENESATAGLLSYRVTVNRAWPGFPLTGTFLLGGSGSTPLSIPVPVPDTAAVGAVDLTLWVGDTAVPEEGSVCTRHLHDATTPTRLALVESSVAEDGTSVALTWWSPDGSAPVTVQRRDDGSDWSTLATRTPDASGGVVYIDRAVVPGASYEYRAGVAEAGVWAWSDPAPVTMSAGAARLAIGDGHALVARGALDVSYTLPHAGSARLGAYDVRGRLVAARSLDAQQAGRASVRLAEARELPAGIYFLRLAQGGKRVQARALLLPGP